MMQLMAKQLIARRAHEGDPHRGRRRQQRDGTGTELPPAEPKILLLRGPTVVHGLRRRQPRVHEDNLRVPLRQTFEWRYPL